MHAFSLLLAACVDYGLQDKGEPPFDSGAPPPPDSEDSAETGETGETSADPCGLVAPPAGVVTPDDACASGFGAEVTDPWNVVVEWSYYAGDRGVATMPAVGNLTDDDGDGDIDGDDVPEIAVVEWFGYLSLLDGPTGARRWRLTGFDGTVTPAIADVTGDGAPEILAVNERGEVVALDAGGTPRWTSPPVEYTFSQGVITVADLEGDGVAEVLYDDAVLDGPTGAILARIDSTKLYYTWRAPVPADVDLDGEQDIVIGNVIARPDGSIRASVDPIGPAFIAVGNLDEDPEAEIVQVTVREMRVYDHDLSLTRLLPMDATLVGPPAIADFDGDGAAEIAIPDGFSVRVVEADGTPVWTALGDDQSGATGLSGFDVDGDGAIDVLYAGEDRFRIFDGRTGELRFEDADHDSQTLFEYPVVADVDGDGSAEILVASALYHGGHLGITAYGHAAGGWGAAGPTWGMHDFAVTNLGADGSVPAGGEPPWLVHNTFRARPAQDTPGIADLFLELGEPCVTSCDEAGWVEIPWQAGNRGARPTEAATVTLYARFADREEALTTAPVPAMEPGVKAPGGVFVVPATALVGATGYAARVDDAPADCDPDNAAVSVDARLCP